MRSLNHKLDRQTPSSLRFQRAAAAGAKPFMKRLGMSAGSRGV
jgi:hypothetical protein